MRVNLQRHLVSDSDAPTVYVLLSSSHLQSVLVNARPSDGLVSADFTLSGQSILSHGFLRAYMPPSQASSPSSSSTSGSTEDSNAQEEFMPHHVLSKLAVGDQLTCKGLKTLSHTTIPPRR